MKPIDEKNFLTSQIQWDDTWPRIFDHYQQDLRHAYYVNAMLCEQDKMVLELGAGSFRDMALLNRLGISCWGTDFSVSAVELAKHQFPELSSQIFQGDAFCLDKLSDKEFDVSFHNGLWVLFENEKILQLLAEQVRVSRRIVMATVHNAHNLDFVSYFRRLGESDPLYRIRFFEVDEIHELMSKICHTVNIFPVGKGKKYFEDDMINRGDFSRDKLHTFFERSGLDNLAISERLLCIGYI